MPMVKYFPTVPTFRFWNDRLPRIAEDASATTEWCPRADIYEKDDAYEVSLELPGLGKDDVKVAAENGVLSVSGERSSDHSDDGGDYYRRERTYGSFRRSFRLPEGVDGEKISATFRNGVLTLLVPKAAEILPRTIEISD